MLDEIVVDTVPEYAAIVAAELSRFEQAAVVSRRKMDAPYRAPWSLTPLGDHLNRALPWVFIFAIASSFGLLFPNGRGGVTIPFGWLPTVHALAAIFFMLAALAQIGRWALYRDRVPPADALAWVSVALGVPVVVKMLWVSQIGVPTPGWALVVASFALFLSVCASVIRLAKRRRDPVRTKKADAFAKGRTREVRRNVLTLADVSGDRLAAAFAALPDPERRRLGDELIGVVRELETRNLATVTNTTDSTRGRGILPGFPMLSHRVAAVGAKVDARVAWYVRDYVDERVSMPPSGVTAEQPGR